MPVADVGLAMEMTSMSQPILVDEAHGDGKPSLSPSAKLTVFVETVHHSFLSPVFIT